MTGFTSIVDGQSGERLIRNAFSKTGPLKDVKGIDAKTVTFWTGRVPDTLIDVWVNFGIGTLNDGRLRLCLPEEFEPVTKILFGNDPDFFGDTYAIAVGAFGDIFFWSERHWLCQFSIYRMAFFAPALFHPDLKKNSNKTVIDYILSADPWASDMGDIDGKPMYSRVREALGPLPEKSLYGIMPEPGNPDNFRVEAIQIVPELEYLKLALDTMTFLVTDPATNDVKQRVGANKW